MNDPVEISRALLDATRSRSSEGDELRARLAGVDVFALTPDDARIAFWLNLYNALVLAELAREARRGSLLRHRSLFAADVARIGDHDYSLDLIEHGVLRRNARPLTGCDRCSGRAIRGVQRRRRPSTRGFTSPSTAARSPARRSL